MRHCKRCRQPLRNHRFHATGAQCNAMLRVAQRLEELERVFEYQGGRGIELADEIDELRRMLCSSR